MSANGEWELRHDFFSRYVPKATRIIVPNEAGREQLVRYLRVEPDRVLLLRHPTPEFALAGRLAAAAAARRARPHGHRRALPALPGAVLGAQEPRDAASRRWRAARPEYELVCVGSDKGQLEHLARLAAELGVLDRVRFLGFVPTDELVALYRDAHALVYLSLFGPENLPPLEAIALGCPVVPADVPGAREQLGDAALRVPPLDPAALAEAVRRSTTRPSASGWWRPGASAPPRFTADGYVRRGARLPRRVRAGPEDVGLMRMAECSS